MSSKYERKHHKIVTGKEGDLIYYGERKHSTARFRLRQSAKNKNPDNVIARAAVAGMLTSVSATIMAAGTALAGVSPFACGAAMVALYSFAGMSVYQNIPKAFVIGCAATAAGFVMASFTPIPVHAACFGLSFGAYLYHNGR